ncbi:hypothetical protein OCAR_7207 [Afipia carboxidovorans OM5]|nr:hypothetical protein OCAR_7207 [Afipia carboxidovorans OM5]
MDGRDEPGHDSGVAHGSPAAAPLAKPPRSCDTPALSNAGSQR